MPGPDDDALLGELAEALDHHDPVPFNVHRVATAGFALIGLDRELATLTHDSVDEREPVGVRSVDAVRSLVFAVGLEELQVHVGSGLLVGAFTGIPDSEIVVFVRETQHVVHTDPKGAFALDPALTGPMRIEVTSQGKIFSTDWFLI